jgi:hypothetical protein
VDLTLQARNGEQWIKQGKGAIRWTQLSRRAFAANPMRPDDVFVIYTDSLQPSAQAAVQNSHRRGRQRGGIFVSTQPIQVGIATSSLLSQGSAAGDKAARLRALGGSAVGSAVEWYDYFLYGTMAGIVFGPLFFPSDNPSVSLMLFSRAGLNRHYRI